MKATRDNDKATGDPLNVCEFEALARDRMEPGAYDYYAGAAGDERTLAENRLGFDRLVFRPRVLVDVSRIDLSSELLGQPVSFPVLLAPTAFNRIGHPDGELAAVRAAGAARTAFVASTMASCSLEEIAAEATASIWFQLYVYRNREMTRDLVQRAESSGYRALVLTADMPRLGRREHDIRNSFVPPAGVTSPAGALGSSAPTSHNEYVHSLFDPSLTWEAVAWLKSLTKLPVVVKGLLTPEDAEESIAAGASGLIVSNHGGRQLDGAIATIDALPDIADRVAGRVPILLDGGVRRGTDVLKALALGAQGVDRSAVLVGSRRGGRNGRSPRAGNVACGTGARDGAGRVSVTRRGHAIAGHHAPLTSEMSVYSNTHWSLAFHLPSMP